MCLSQVPTTRSDSLGQVILSSDVNHKVEDIGQFEIDNNDITNYNKLRKSKFKCKVENTGLMISHSVYKLEKLSQNVFKYVQTPRNTANDCNWPNETTLSVIKGTLSLDIREKLPQTINSCEEMFQDLFSLKYSADKTEI
ncbi:hypothetical protein M153_5920001678 [Pseudoloma neurophilia]|uniref:Uncharacterized protein n=1 Tax=Pseudoloma neurophilia TaxID=146866 RepID=A0A0R0LWM7_9MICR|nr:hypothetical protein M153_5920001678 [Pseudoloma neurophilia]